MISSSRFPLESVFLGSTASNFASAVMDAQKGCISTNNEKSCNANTTYLEGDVLEAAMAYSAAAVNSTTTATTGAATPAPDLTASWGLPGWPGPALEAQTQQPAAPATQHPDDITPAAGPPAEQTMVAQPPPADAPLVILPTPAILPTGASKTASGASAVAMSSSDAVAVSASAGTSATVSGPLSKDRDGWLKPIKTSELFEEVFGTAEYKPSNANYPGTKAALSSLKILLRIPAPKKT